MFGNDPKNEENIIRRLSPKTWAADFIDTPLSIFAKGSNLAHSVTLMSKDPDFYDRFIQAVPDHEQQIKYLINTSRFILGEPFDADYVLMFRRTLPSAVPKPECHWTSDYIIARNGLSVEIPAGPHRYHSVVLCASYSEILKEGGLQPAGFTDGEVRVLSTQFEQARALAIIKPQHEILSLENYMQLPDALSCEQVLRLVMDSKNKP